MLVDGKIFVLHENYLCDVTEFIDQHPGGRIHIEESIGLDVSRCVTGTAAINGKFDPYDHSMRARLQLMSFAIAELVEDHRLCVQSDKR
jgi:hypothetical protein